MEFARVKVSRWAILIVLVLFLIVGMSLVVVVGAAPMPWVQTDWSGGVSPGVVTTQVNTFDSQSNIDFGVAGEISLPLTAGWPTGLNNWQYRKPVTVNNPGVANTDYQVSFTLDTQSLIAAGKLKNDCADLRVTDDSGTLLDMWIEGPCDDSGTVIWTKLSTLPVGNTDIYIYYGNSAAASVSDANATFEYYIDFTVDGVLTTGSQDVQPSNYAIEDAGRTLYMFGNNWKRTPKTVNINGNGTQLLEMSYMSTDYGEVQGIGFHNGNDISSNSRTYKTGGTQSYGIPWDNPYSGSGNFETISAILDDFSGTFANWVWANDDDSSPSGNERFKDVRIRKYQGVPPAAGAPAAEESKYPATGTLTSNVLDIGFPGDWGNLSFTTSMSSFVTVKVRTDSNSSMAGAAAWGSCAGIISASDISNNSCVNDTDQYLQYRIILTPDSGSSPVFEEISIDYVASDLTPPPTNATNLGMITYNDGDWTNEEVTFTWTAGADDFGGSGILGYCVSLDEAPIGLPNNLNPALSAGKLAGLDDGVPQTYCPFIATGNSLNLDTVPGLNLNSGQQYYLSIKAVDNSGNIWTGPAGQFQNLVSFIYDATAPQPPGYISLPGNFISTKNVTITWPTIGIDAPDDSHSGLAGLQYRIGPSGTWYGANHNGNEDLTDILLNTGSYTTDPTFDYPVLQDGINYIYFRSIDNVGNTSNYVSGVLKINTVAPGPVQNLSVSPANNTINAYSFDWDAPTAFSGQESKITYCYTVNTLPTSVTCNYTGQGITSLNTDAYATQPGNNTMYVVARDEALNINYGTYTAVNFDYSGSAPGIPGNLQVADISIRAQSDWRLALTWAVPVNVGPGISKYKIFRSTTATSCSANFAGFSEVGESSSTSFIDVGLNQVTYNYCVKACDSANNCSAVSSTVNELPTGRYTTPANLISGPEILDKTTRTAQIQWVTDRQSDSRIRYGLSSNNYFPSEVGSSNQVTSHAVDLNNLSPGTTYYFKARWTDTDGNTGISNELTFTTDPPPQVISNVVTDIRTDSAIVNFSVRNTSRATILYGRTESFGGATSIFTSEQETNYSIKLEDLQDGSNYFYKIVLEDSEGNSYDSLEINSFKTLPTPRVSNVEVEEIVSEAQPTLRVLWDSNTDITSVVSFYPEGRVELTRDEVELEFKQEHELLITALLPDTRYVMIVKGVDKFGNEAVSDVFVFDTAADSRPPRIENISVDSSTTNVALGDAEKSQLIVSWETDEPATSQVEFGAGVEGAYSSSTVVDQIPKYQHIVVLPDLNPSNVYHLRVVSSDEAGNQAESGKLITVTPQAGSDTLELVIGRLSEVFSFLN